MMSNICNGGTIVSFIISDIISDPIEFIASGPTHPDTTTYSDAEKILIKYGLWTKVPQSARYLIENGIINKIPETPKKNDSVFLKVYNYIIANNDIACKSAEKKAEELGYKTMLLTTHLEGEAKDAGKYLVERTINYLTKAKKMVFISGVEDIHPD